MSAPSTMAVASSSSDDVLVPGAHDFDERLLRDAAAVHSARLTVRALAVRLAGNPFDGEARTLLRRYLGSPMEQVLEALGRVRSALDEPVEGPRTAAAPVLDEVAPLAPPALQLPTAIPLRDVS